ncbi:hypothetical protein B0T25DRAFT_205269 [Lasiosphaeria hispida]|uniref:Uncharacterized protein n=1 Tax=Lasiosphaeria hispida TaxID=260671 RepID=A0AAJ0HIT0_9PEZI|nr:hypothetical protein B0T25DRAFT_205269 [Lasiosphaeria hispida]
MLPAATSVRLSISRLFVRVIWGRPVSLHPFSGRSAQQLRSSNTNSHSTLILERQGLLPWYPCPLFSATPLAKRHLTPRFSNWARKASNRSVYWFGGEGVGPLGPGQGCKRPRAAFHLVLDKGWIDSLAIPHPTAL